MSGANVFPAVPSGTLVGQAVQGYFETAPVGYVLTRSAVQVDCSASDTLGRMPPGATWGAVGWDLDGTNFNSYSIGAGGVVSNLRYEGGTLEVTAIYGALTSAIFRTDHTAVAGSPSDLVDFAATFPGVGSVLFVTQCSFVAGVYTFVVGWTSTAAVGEVQISKVTVDTTNLMAETVVYTTASTVVTDGTQGAPRPAGLIGDGAYIYVSTSLFSSLLVKVSDGTSVVDPIITGLPGAATTLYGGKLSTHQGKLLAVIMPPPEVLEFPSATYVLDVSTTGAAITVGAYALTPLNLVNTTELIVGNGGRFYLINPSGVRSVAASTADVDYRVNAGRHPFVSYSYAIASIKVAFEGLLNGHSTLGVHIVSAYDPFSGSYQTGELTTGKVHFGELFQYCKQEIVKV